MQLLGLTAEASVMNCGKLAALDAGSTLAALADAALERPGDRQLRWDLIRWLAWTGHCSYIRFGGRLVSMSHPLGYW